MTTNASSTDKQDTNVGFHPPAENDAPATRSMFFIILLLLVVGFLLAVFAYKYYNKAEPPVPATEQVSPPLVP